MIANWVIGNLFTFNGWLPPNRMIMWSSFTICRLPRKVNGEASTKGCKLLPPKNIPSHLWELSQKTANHVELRFPTSRTALLSERVSYQLCVVSDISSPGKGFPCILWDGGWDLNPSLGIRSIKIHSCNPTKDFLPVDGLVGCRNRARILKILAPFLQPNYVFPTSQGFPMHLAFLTWNSC